MSDDLHTISAGGVTASIKAVGAELCSLKTTAGLELLWQAGPAASCALAVSERWPAEG